MSSNPITGVTNSSPPAADEALSYGSAQQYFASFGNVQKPVADYSALSTDGLIVANGTFTVALPTTGMVANQGIRITNSGSGTITMSSASNINGAATFVNSTQYQGNTFVWDGSTWWTF